MKKWHIKHPVYEPDTATEASSVAEYMKKQESQLKKTVTTAGGKATNFAMKQAAYRMACLYHTTQNEAYAEKAVVLLERFAEVVPKWPLLLNTGEIPVPDDCKDVLPLDKVDWGDWRNGGLWGDWYFMDLLHSVDFVKTYDLVYNSKALGDRGLQSRQFIEEKLLRYVVEFNLKTSHHVRVLGFQKDGRPYPQFSNMNGNSFLYLIPFGTIFDPQYIHMILKTYRKFPFVAYSRDGMWHEASPTYHNQISHYLYREIPFMLKNYSDPDGYIDKEDESRIDNLDLQKEFGLQFERMKKAVKWLILPNNTEYVLHDTHSNESIDGATKDSSQSHCLFGMRHAILGQYSKADQIQVHLHFGGTDGHEHGDCLNLGMWALGEELLSEGEYKKFGNRQWAASSFGHNLVVVDEKNQSTRFERQVATTQDDAVDGLDYNPCVDGHGNTRNFGNLHLWDPTHPDVMVVEADGENAYGKETTPIYRRTIVMVRTNGKDFYLIDVFRVKGGNIHDWMLHGRLDEDYAFHTDLSMQDLSESRGEYLKICRKITTDSLWTTEFHMKSGANIRTTMVGFENTEISVCRAPAMRRAGEATFLDVRRRGGDNMFVSVHEPYKDEPKVTRITPLEYTGTADASVSLKIELENGRTDYFASTLDQPDYPLHDLQGTDISFRGRLLHIAEENDSPSWMLLKEGSELNKKDIKLVSHNGDYSCHGRIIDVKRKEKGDSWNGFVTESALPSENILKGKTLLLLLGDGRTEGYTISGIDATGSKTHIHVEGEPGIELRDNGDLAKFVYYPWHGVRGGMKFLIPGSVYRDRNGNVTSTDNI